MSLSRYQILNAVIEYGSVTKAAESLHVTQSGASHAISSLEKELGFPLLVRSRTGVQLTGNGELVMKHIRAILEKQEQLKQEVALINGLEIGTVRIGTFPSVSIHWLPKLLKQFQTLFPAIEVKLREGNYEDVENWISDGEVDFGFITLPAKEKMDIVPLKKDRMLCILPLDHPLSRQSHIAFEQLQGEPFIMPMEGCDHDVLRLLERHSVKPNVRYKIEEDQAIISMVRNGLGISILPEMIIMGAAEDIAVRNFSAEAYRSLGLATTKNKQVSPASQRFIDCVKQWVKDDQIS